MNNRNNLPLKTRLSKPMYACVPTTANDSGAGACATTTKSAHRRRFFSRGDRHSVLLLEPLEQDSLAALIPRQRLLHGAQLFGVVLRRPRGRAGGRAEGGGCGREENGREHNRDRQTYVRTKDSSGIQDAEIKALLMGDCSPIFNRDLFLLREFHRAHRLNSAETSVRARVKSGRVCVCVCLPTVPIGRRPTTIRSTLLRQEILLFCCVF